MKKIKFYLIIYDKIFWKQNEEIRYKINRSASIQLNECVQVERP